MKILINQIQLKVGMVITDGSYPLAGRSTEVNYCIRTIHRTCAKITNWARAPWTVLVNLEITARFFAADVDTTSIRSR